MQRRHAQNGARVNRSGKQQAAGTRGRTLKNGGKGKNLGCIFTNRAVSSHDPLRIAVLKVDRRARPRHPCWIGALCKFSWPEASFYIDAVPPFLQRDGGGRRADGRRVTYCNGAGTVNGRSTYVCRVHVCVRACVRACGNKDVKKPARFKSNFFCICLSRMLFDGLCLLLSLMVPHHNATTWSWSNTSNA